MQSDQNEITAYTQLMGSSLSLFVRASEALGEPLREMAYKVRKAFEEQYNFIRSATLIRNAPDDGSFAQMLSPLADTVSQIERFREQNRSVAAYFNHLSTVSESIQALCWVSVKPAPTQFLKDMRESGEYFGNRVLSSHRGDAAHVEWLNKWYQVLRDLEEYVRTYHRTGFSWGAGAANIPPPPFPPAVVTLAGPSNALAAGDTRTALLNQLNQGVNITRMLRPVTRQDRALREEPAVPRAPAQSPSGEVPFDSPAIIQGLDPAPFASQGGAIPRVSSTSGSVQARPAPAPVPKFILDGVKWRVENQRSNHGLTLRTENMNESLAMYRCEHTALVVASKMNNISIDSCKKSSVSLHGVISSVDLIRCKNMKLQLNDSVPLINMDNCDCIQVYVTEPARDVQIISSSSTSCNVCLVIDEGNYEEIPIPEQIRTTIAHGGIHSEVIKVE